MALRLFVDQSHVTLSAPKSNPGSPKLRKHFGFWILAFFLATLAPATRASGSLSFRQARDLIVRTPGVALPKSSVRVKSISAAGASEADATAIIETSFRLEQNERGRWRVAEIRTGANQWEAVDRIARAFKSEAVAGPCDNADLNLSGPARSDLSPRRARCVIASLAGVQLPSDAVRVKEVSSLSVPLASKPSALVVALVEAEFRFSRSTGNWRVTKVKTGNREWAEVAMILGGVNTEKGVDSRAELAAIAAALEAFRRERGFYVESDSEAVLVDHLSPRFLSRVIRLDPWRQPYQYRGTREHFTLSSNGADGKKDTVDDIVLTGPMS